MTKVKACKNCRVKKLKCDGRFPICVNCSGTDESSLCNYATSQQKKVIKLYKKEACLPCRRKKKRCDAVRPICGKCRVSRTKGDTCTYDAYKKNYDGVDLSLIERSSSQESEESCEALTFISVTPISFKPKSYRINPSLFAEISPHALQPNIIRNPLLSLTDADDPFAFALSGVSLEDLNMKFRLIFLSQRFIHGVHFPELKLRALLVGDTLSPHLHPFFVHFSNLAGAQFYQERRGSYSVLPIQARHLVLSQEALATMSEEEDPFLFAQANFYMGCAYSYARSLKLGKRHFKRAGEIIRRNHIRFVPISQGGTELNTAVCSTEPLDVVQERVTLLAQMVFSEVAFYLIGQPSLVIGFVVGDEERSDLPTFYSEAFSQDDRPATTSLELEEQFRYELPVAYPHLVSPVISRAQSAIFVKDAGNLITWFQQQATPSERWLSTCRIFLTQLTNHIGVLQTRITESTDTESRLSFRFSSIISLTGYAQVVFVLATSPTTAAPSAVKFTDECCDALRRIITTVEKLEQEEFLALGGFLGIAWSRALALFGVEKWKSPSPGSNRGPSYSPVAATVSKARSAITKPEHQHNLKNQSDMAAYITRLNELNLQFLGARFMPGILTLCARLEEHTMSRRSTSP